MAVLRLKKVMEEKQVSREDLADRVGVSKTTITNIRQEDNLPTIKLLLEIANALDVDIRDLFMPTKGGVISESEVNEVKELMKGDGSGRVQR